MLGADPAWMFGGPDARSPTVGLAGSGWMDVRRPVRFHARSRLQSLAPCVEPIASLEVCGGWLEREDEALLAGKRWSLESGGGAEGAHRASLRLGPEGRRMGTWMEQGELGWASGARLDWGNGPWGVEGGAQRSRQVDSLRVRASEGAMDLSWPAMTDSVGFALRLPAGTWSLRAQWWNARRRSPETLGNRLSDTTRISGWGLAVQGAIAGGKGQARLWREDRHGIVTGYRDRDVFLEQVVESERAEMAMDWRGRAWDLSLSRRQWRVSSPRGRLDHPSIHWNRLSRGDFAPFSSLVEDRSDYLWGTFSVKTWDLVAGRTFAAGDWILHPRWSARLLDLDADLQRVRLVVKTFLPSTARDTLASGAGWLALTGPRLDLSRAWRWGTTRAWAEIRFPVAGDWTDRASNPVAPSSSAAPPKAKSLPIDPLGSWQWGGSWEF